MRRFSRLAVRPLNLYEELLRMHSDQSKQAEFRNQGPRISLIGIFFASTAVAVALGVYRPYYQTERAEKHFRTMLIKNEALIVIPIGDEGDDVSGIESERSIVKVFCGMLDDETASLLNTLSDSRSLREVYIDSEELLFRDADLSVFPYVTDLTFSMYGGISSHDIEKLSDAFPNVVKLELEEELKDTESILLLTRFRRLQELNLSYYMEDIPGTLKVCRKLPISRLTLYGRHFTTRQLHANEILGMQDE